MMIGDSDDPMEVSGMKVAANVFPCLDNSLEFTSCILLDTEKEEMTFYDI